MKRFYRSDSAERNWRTNIAFWIAGKELWAWKNKNTRIVARMMESYTEQRIIKLLDDWRCGHPDCDGDKTEVCYPKHYLIARIKGENK